ncbi:MAG: hypothetical protein R3D85_12540 [Paracoccaceae bacterium]
MAASWDRGQRRGADRDRGAGWPATTPAGRDLAEEAALVKALARNIDCDLKPGVVQRLLPLVTEGAEHGYADHLGAALRLRRRLESSTARRQRLCPSPAWHGGSLDMCRPATCTRRTSPWPGLRNEAAGARIYDPACADIAEG